MLEGIKEVPKNGTPVGKGKRKVEIKSLKQEVKTTDNLPYEEHNHTLFPNKRTNATSINDALRKSLETRKFMKMPLSFPKR